MIKSINPATDEIIQSYPIMGDGEIEKILSLTSDAQKTWEKTNFETRKEKMKKAAAVLRDNLGRLAGLMTDEMGKPINQSKSEVEKCAWVCEYFAENAEKFLDDELIVSDASKSFVSYRPLGTVLAIMPWNFPFWQVFRFAAPNLIGGNGGILKHASNVTGCALAIENIFKEAGFPENIFRTLVLPSHDIKKVIENRKIAAVTLTGSVPAGKSVAAAAGGVIKKTVMELGGSDPYLILEDADLEAAAEICVSSRLINNGQSCIAAKRFIIVESVYKEFENLFVEKMNQKTLGDPRDPAFDIGPLARKDLRTELHQQVLQSQEKGAELMLGGKLPDGKGAYYPATVLANVAPGMPAYDDELFGPVASLIRVKDEKSGIAAANDSVFGLGAAVFTGDIKRGERIAKEELQAGCCFVNEFVRSDPRLPFGGVKESGYGRELSIFGIREFMNIKTVYVK